MLRFLVEESLAGRGDQLKGYNVAVGVLGRDENFNPQGDPIVRIEARRLRTDIDRYYMSAGSSNPLRLSIPKGRYEPVVERQSFKAPANKVSDSEEAASESLPSGANRGRTRLVLLGMLVAISALAVAGLLWKWLDYGGFYTAQTHSPALIVLPFESLDAGENTRLFASSMTGDLISDLMGFPNLRLYSAGASFRQAPDADPTVLGDELGVAYVIRGNVQSVSGKIRLSAQLSDASTGQVLWSDSYFRTTTSDELLTMRSELSSTVATTLGETYGIVYQAITHRLASGDTPSMASYSCVQRAFVYRFTFEDKLFAPALACLKSAVVEEPDYADAWAMLAWLHLDAARQDMVPEIEHPANMSAAHTAATRALALDPYNQRGLQALAALVFSNGDYAEAERLQRRALALNPHDPEILVQLGWRLAVRGNWDDGLPLLEKAIARSANPPGWYFHLISVHNYIKGDYVAALAAAERSAKVGSAIGLSLAAISQAKLGNMDDASQALKEMAEAWPLLAHDPAAAYGNFQVDGQIIAVLVEGLRAAGWKPPDTESQ